MRNPSSWRIGSWEDREVFDRLIKLLEVDFPIVIQIEGQHFFPIIDGDLLRFEPQIAVGIQTDKNAPRSPEICRGSGSEIVFALERRSVKSGTRSIDSGIGPCKGRSVLEVVGGSESGGNENSSSTTIDSSTVFISSTCGVDSFLTSVLIGF